MAITNSTEDGNHTITKSSVALQFLEQLRTLSFHCIFVGNILIIVALQKVSSLHPPSKHLLSCLASTDLGVGLIHIPLRGGIHLSRDHSKDWYYFWFLFIITSLLFSGVSLLTMTAIRVDRLLAPFLGLRYRQVVTVRRVMILVDTLWVSSCYLPYGVISSFMIITGLETRPLYYTWSLKISLMLFNSTLNPFLYCWRMREMIQRVKDIIRRFSCPSQKAT